MWQLSEPSVDQVNLTCRFSIYDVISIVISSSASEKAKAFIDACDDAEIEGLVWHDLRATYGTRLGEAGVNAYDAFDIAKPMGHANSSTSKRYVRNLPVGAGEAVMLKMSAVTATQSPRSQSEFRAL